MFIADNLFTSGTDYSRHSNLHKDIDLYAPWEEEVQNFKKAIHSRPNRKRLISEHRYPSQI